MNIMHRFTYGSAQFLCLCAMLSVLLSPSLSAQQQEDRFELGISGVFGNVRYPVPNRIWADWVTDTAETGSTRTDAIPSNRWQQLQELGVTMAHVNVVAAAVTDGADNVAAKLNRAAWLRGLSLSLGDSFIRRASSLERRVYHVEAALDFAKRSGGDVVMEPEFALLRPRSDFHDLDSARTSNALHFAARSDAGAVVSGFRQGKYLFAKKLGSTKPSGRYVLSVRCLFDASALPVSNDTVLSVSCSGSAGGVVFALTADQLRTSTGAGAPPHEIVLGRLLHEEHKTAEGIGSRVQAVEKTNTPPERNASTRTKAAMSLELRYHGGIDITVDAIILSDERAFALFNPSHPATAESYSMERAGLVKRLKLLGADSTCAYPALRYLEMREISSRNGGYPVVRLIGTLLEDMAGSRRPPVRPYIYMNAATKSYSERLRRDAAGMRDVVSGQYVYLYEEKFKVRPEDPAYYDSLYFPVAWSKGGRNTWLNAQSYSTWNRYFAISRKAGGVKYWMPPIQNHSWLFRGGWPASEQTDSAWLYEPAAAEQRMVSNIKLCYGATSLMLYLFQSWPGRARVPVVHERENAEYWDMGAIGVMDPHSHEPRTVATNGESKWDSTRVLLTRFLKPLTAELHGKIWERGYNTHRHLAQGVEGTVTRAFSWIPGTFDVDTGERTFVEIGEYSDPEHPDDLLLVVLNKRVDRRGTRTILLIFDEQFSEADVLFPGGSVWQGLDSDPASMQLTLQPGHAALLRLKR